ncbi:MAG TPA: exodeoxyribonuclease VII large subunit [Flexivirga sp.]|uniref:exodeoxyribonuclease VII large subunit n=1 Tax=Flexivirga sp. TaxID=1962927 RepID=UPI002CD1F541|nr:exodeoxyribonuclease VII large subunit [Flexivirga sp.]HWC23856.1 exodeoxyribonuclease VII large subunit [Flexivirga sp.]
MSGEWWESVPEVADVFGGVRRRLTGHEWETLTGEIVSVRRHGDHGKSLTLIVGIAENQFADVDAVIEDSDLHNIRRFFGSQQKKLELAPGRGITVRGVWRMADHGGRLVFHIRHVGLNVTEVGPASRWRDAQRAIVTASRNFVPDRPQRKSDRQIQFSDIRDRLECRNIVVIGHRNAEGGNDLSKRVQAAVREKLEYTNQAVQGQPDVIARDIARRLNKVSSHDTALVVIVRGGGGAANRMPFDAAMIANAIIACTNRNVPVVTALGHTRDTHLADLVAWCCCATPTDAATLLNSIWYADPVVPTLANDPAELPAQDPIPEPAPPAVSAPSSVEPASSTPPSATPSGGSSVAEHGDKSAGCLTIGAVLLALLVALVLLVHFFSSSADSSKPAPSSVSGSPSSRVFLSPSRNILGTAARIGDRLVVTQPGRLVWSWWSRIR